MDLMQSFIRTKLGLSKRYSILDMMIKKIEMKNILDGKEQSVKL
jgi:hypothetical protein